MRKELLQMRNLKMLGLAVIAALALSALAASGANATAAHFTGDSTSANVIVKATADPSEPEQEFVTEFGIVSCDIAFAIGTSPKTTETAAFGEVEYNGDYFAPSNACDAFGLEAEVHFNGCGYLFHAGVYDGGGMATGTVDITCGEGEGVEIDVSGLCTISIPAQAGLGVVTYTNGGGTPQVGTVDVNIGESIEYSGEGLLCAGEFSTGSFFGKGTVRYFEDTPEGRQVAATITST